MDKPVWDARKCSGGDGKGHFIFVGSNDLIFLQNVKAFYTKKAFFLDWFLTVYLLPGKWIVHDRV